MERQCNSSVTGGFGNREVSTAESELAAIEWLKMDRPEVVAALNTTAAQITQDSVSVSTGEVLIQSDAVDEPAGDGAGFLYRWDDSGYRFQTASVHPGNRAATDKDLLQPLHLRTAQSGGKFVKAIIVAEANVLKPCSCAGTPALVCHAPAEFGNPPGVGNNHPTLAGGELLVGIEGEGRSTGK